MSPTVAIAGVDGNPQLHGRRQIELRDPPAHRGRGAERPRRVIRLGQRRAEDSQHGVADELVQRAFLGEHRFGQLAEALVQQLAPRPSASSARPGW